MPDPKRLLILGATGGIGGALVNQAIERGHRVTAFVRSPDKLATREGLTVCAGDPLSVAALRAALPGHDAVLSALGPAGLGPTTIVRNAARSTAVAMEAAGVKRLLVVSAAVLFRDEGIVVALLRNTLLRNIAQDCTEMERVLGACSLDWTIVRPPRLTNGPLTGHFQIEDGRMPRGGRAVSRADVAQFMLDELEQGTHIRKIVGMAGGQRTAPG